MKIDNIKKMVNSNKTIYLHDIPGGQWISNGYCAAPITGMPPVDEKSVLKMISVEDSKEFNYFVRTQDCMPFSLKDKEIGHEQELIKMKMNIVWNGQTLSVFKCDTGAVLVQSKYIKLFGDVDEIDFTLRNGAVALFDGMLLIGYIMPYKVSYDIITELKELMAMLLTAGENGMTLEADAENAQIGIDSEEEE